MNTTCPHCLQPLEIDRETLELIGDAASFECPSCGQQVSKTSLPDSQDATPSQNQDLQETAETAADGGRSLLAAFWGLNRNLRILGGLALLLLGGLGIFIASRRTGDTLKKHQKIHNQVISNDYFTRLIASGATTSMELEGVENILPNSSGFIGVSKDTLSWRQARELADRTGGEVLDVTISAKNSRKELTRWLAETYPAQQGSTVWISANGETRVIDCPDVLSTANLEQSRRVFLHWPKSEMWKNLGWSWTIQPQFDEVTPFSEWGLARVRVGKAWGLIDESGKTVQEPAFDLIEPFAEQGSARVTKDGKWGLLDRNGKLVAKPEWENVQHFINGFIPVKKDGKWGYLDADGRMTIPSVWDDAWRFSPEGFAVVIRNGKRGFIDRSGKVIVEPAWDGAINFAKEGIGMVRRGAGWGLIDTSGKLLIEPKWNLDWRSRRFDLGFIMSETTSKLSVGQLSLLGFDGLLMTADMKADGYTGLGESDAGLLLGKGKHGIGGDWTLFGAEGKPIVQAKAGAIYPFHDGLAMVESEGNVGFINMNGVWAIPLRPGKMRDFHEGFAASEASGKWGFIDRSGKVAVKQEWDEVQDFSEGYAAAKQDGKWGIVNRSGKIVVKPEWDEVTAFHEGIAAVRRGGKWGFVDETGRIVAEPQWERVGVFSKGLAAVLRKGTNYAPPTWIFINRTGDPAFGDRSWRIPTERYDFQFGSIGAENQSHQQVRIFPDGRETPVNGLTFEEFFGLPKLLLPLGLVAPVTERPGNYLNRHGDAGFSMMLSDQTGATVMPGVNRSTDLLSDFVPYAAPPKYGLIDAAGKIWVEPSWDEARILSADWVWIRVGAKCGLADNTGKICIAPAWDELEVLPVDSGSLDDDGRSVLVGGGGKGFLSPWVRVEDGGKVKILRTDGQPAIPDSLGKAEYVDFYGPAHVVIKQPDGQGNWTWSLYEPATGNQVMFPSASTFRWNWNMASAGVIWMKDKVTAQWRLMDRKGNSFGHSQPELEKPDGWGFVQGRGLLHKPDGWVFVDTEIKPISADKWEEARDFSEERAAVRRGGKWGFIGLDGKVLINPVFDEVGDFSRGLAAVRRQIPGNAERRWGYIDLTGKVVIEPVWDAAKPFRQWFGEPTAEGQTTSLDVAEVKLKELAAVIDRSGALVVDPFANSLFRGGGALANGGDNYIVMKNGGTVAFVKRAWGTHEGVEVSPTRAWLRSKATKDLLEPEWMLVDENGKELTKETWHTPWFSPESDPLAGGLLAARTKGQKYGLLRRDGTVAVAPRFDRIAWIAPKVAAVWNRDEGGLINDAGDWIFKDNAKIRIARFGLKDNRKPEAQHRHGLALIEDVPKWGYARLNR